MVVFETIIQESHRLNLYQLMPSLVSTLTQTRLVAATALLKSALTKRSLLNLKHRFTCWRASAGMEKLMTKTYRENTFARAVKRLVSRSQRLSTARMFALWK